MMIAYVIWTHMTKSCENSREQCRQVDSTLPPSSSPLNLSQYHSHTTSTIFVILIHSTNFSYPPTLSFIIYLGIE